ncbi:hypothetical protein Tco_1142518 [Tanacetum coccineum]
MASESSSQSQQQQQPLTRASKVHFKRGDDYSENYVLVLKKETVRVSLATLGLVDENNPSLSSTSLVNSSPLKMRYFSPIWRVLMMERRAENLMFAISVAKLLTEPEETLILSFGKVNADDIADKSLSRTTVQPVTQSKAPT